MRVTLEKVQAILFLSEVLVMPLVELPNYESTT